MPSGMRADGRHAIGLSPRPSHRIAVPAGPAAARREAVVTRPCGVGDRPDSGPAAATEPVSETVIERGASGHFLAVADVNGEPIRMVVDTGANMVALTTDDARRAHVEFDPAQFTVVGSGASGDVRGQRVLIESISLDGKRVADVPGVVLDGLPVSLLGQTYLAKLDTVQISQGDG